MQTFGDATDPTDFFDKQLSETIDRFLNELELSFDYLCKDHIAEWRKYARTHPAETASSLVTSLEPYSAALTTISMPTRKLRKTDFAFFDTVTLFPDCSNPLSTSVFLTENKNTKRTIGNYMYTMYLLASKGAPVANNMAAFLGQAETPPEVQDRDVPNPVAGAGFGDLMSSLQSNPQLLDLAQDVSAHMQAERIDPMALMSQLMSGTFNMNSPDNTLTKLISSVSETIESKVQRGELDVTQLQQQASSIMQHMSAVQPSPAALRGRRRDKKKK